MASEVVKYCWKCHELPQKCKCSVLSEKQRGQLKKMGFKEFHQMMDWMNRNESRED